MYSYIQIYILQDDILHIMADNTDDLPLSRTRPVPSPPPNSKLSIQHTTRSSISPCPIPHSISSDDVGYTAQRTASGSQCFEESNSAIKVEVKELGTLSEGKVYVIIDENIKV